MGRKYTAAGKCYYSNCIWEQYLSKLYLGLCHPWLSETMTQRVSFFTANEYRPQISVFNVLHSSNRYQSWEKPSVNSYSGNTDFHGKIQLDGAWQHKQQLWTLQRWSGEDHGQSVSTINNHHQSARPKGLKRLESLIWNKARLTFNIILETLNVHNHMCWLLTVGESLGALWPHCTKRLCATPKHCRLSN